MPARPDSPPNALDALDAPTTLYFGYGSNLDAAVRRDALAAAGLPESALEPVRRAYLPDHELAFTRHSGKWRGGVLDVRPRRGALVIGYLFRARGPGAWRVLDAKEGVRAGNYRRLAHLALDLDGDAHPATTYTVCAKVPFVEPAPAYLRTVRRAYRHLGLDEAQLERAATNAHGATVDGALFTYGTLLRGCERHHHLRKPGLYSVLLAEAFGRLHDHGAYPGLVPGGDALVGGELVATRDIATVLDVLDDIEGFRGFGAPDNLFERRVLSIGLGGRLRPAWVYVPRMPAPTRIDAPCWRTHTGVADAVYDAIAAAHADALGGERALLLEIANRGSSPCIDEAAFLDAHRPLGRALGERRLAEVEIASATGLTMVEV